MFTVDSMAVGHILGRRATIEESIMNIQPWVMGGGFYMNGTSS